MKLQPQKMRRWRMFFLMACFAAFNLVLSSFQSLEVVAQIDSHHTDSHDSQVRTKRAREKRSQDRRDQSELQSVGSTSKLDKQQAISMLPLKQLNEQTRKKITDVVEHTSIYRRLPVTTINTDPDMFVFLVRYPELVVNIWEIMGVTKMTATRTGTYELTTDDGVGTTSKADLVYGSPNTHIYYCEGKYDGPLLLRPVKGRCVVVLQTEFFLGRDGKRKAKNRLDVFLKIDNMAASVIAKSVHPLVGSTADHNFVESLNSRTIFL